MPVQTFELEGQATQASTTTPDALATDPEAAASPAPAATTTKVPTGLHSCRLQIAMAITVLLSFMGGLVVLGTAGKVTNFCQTKVYKDQSLMSPDNILGLTIAGTSHIQPFPVVYDEDGKQRKNAVYDCGIHLSLDWFIIAYQVITINVGLKAATELQFHCKHRVMFVYSVNIILVTFVTSIFYKVSYNFNGGMHSDTEMGQATKGVVAGAIAILVSNFSFLILFGMDEESADVSAKIAPAEE